MSNLQIAIHDGDMNVVDHMNNDIPGSIHYRDDSFKMYLSESAYTYSFTVEKRRSNGMLNDRIRCITDEGYFSFTYMKEQYLFTIVEISETDTIMTVTGESLNLELINETTNEFKADKEYTFTEYCAIMNLLQMAKVEIGINELFEEKRKLEFTNEETLLKRLIDLVKQFGGEHEFKTRLYPNGQVDTIILNIYRARTPEFPDYGVGAHRRDIRLYYGRHVSGVTRKIDKRKMFNAIRLRDKNGNLIKLPKERTVLDSDGRRLIYAPRRTNTLYAPLSMKKYPSIAKKNQCDNWTLRDVKTNLENIDEIYDYGVKMLQEHMWPEITYTVELNNDREYLRNNLHIGDTIYINDENYFDGLILQARIKEMDISFTNPLNNKIVLSNFIRISSQISSDLQKRLETLVDDASPYTMTISTSNGVIFKNYKQHSILIPTVLKNATDMTRNMDFHYYKDGVYMTSGSQLDISPKTMLDEDRCVITVVGYKDGDEKCKSEITFCNVNDGKSPINVVVLSSNGLIFKNNEISTTLTAKLFRNDEVLDPDGTEYSYEWSKADSEGNILEWPVDTPKEKRTGKQIVVTGYDVFRRATYFVTVSPIYD